MNFKELANKFSGCAFHIIGSGPTAVSIDPSYLDDMDVVIVLNAAIDKIPEDCPATVFWFAVDYYPAFGNEDLWNRCLRRVAENKVFAVLQNPLNAKDGHKAALAGPGVILFNRVSGHRPELLEYSREQIALSGALYQWCGSATPAVHFAWFLGAEKVFTYGLDGGEGYGAMHESFLEAADKLGVKVLPAELPDTPEAEQEETGEETDGEFYRFGGEDVEDTAGREDDSQDS